MEGVEGMQRGVDPRCDHSRGGALGYTKLKILAALAKNRPTKCHQAEREQMVAGMEDLGGWIDQASHKAYRRGPKGWLRLLCQGAKVVLIHRGRVPAGAD